MSTHFLRRSLTKSTRVNPIRQSLPFTQRGNITTLNPHQRQKHTKVVTPPQERSQSASTSAKTPSPFSPPPSSTSSVRTLRLLRTDNVARSERGELVLFGKTIIGEYIRRGGAINQLYATLDCQLKDIIGVDHLAAIRANSIPPPQLISSANLQRASGVVSTPDDACAAVIALPPSNRPSSFSHSTLVLDNVADPGNVGSLLRSAAAFDFTTVIFIGGCDPFNEKVIRASMGTILQLRLWKATEEEFMAVIKENRDHNSQLIVCDAHPTHSVSLESSSGPSISRPLFLVIGNEAQGVRPSLLSSADTRLHIRMNSGVESLNAAVAGSILMQQIHSKRGQQQ